MIKLRCYAVYAAMLVAASVHVQKAFAAADTTASFSVATATEVPGAVLKPGQYTIQLVDHLSDRAIVRVDSLSGSTHVTFLGVNSSSAASELAHPVEWPAKDKGKHALRGFIFGGGRNVEFVYPKAAAVALANANGTGVVAIDPASEGRPELSKLTSTDMQMVNLWMLTPVRVGPGDTGQKGIEAKRYQASSAPPPAVAGPQPSRGVTAATTSPSSVVARVEVPPSPAVHHTRPTISRLPKTASNLPLVWLGGLLCCAGAAAFRVRRAQRA